MRRLSVLVLSLVLAIPATACAQRAPEPSATGGQTAGRAAAFPALAVTRQVRGLSIPWDVQRLPHRRLLITERENRRLLVWRAGRTRVLRFPSARVWASGETGLMSLAVDPAFTTNRRVYTCQGGFTSSGHDVRVVAWRMNAGYTGVRRIRTLLAGLPATSGRHGGCRLLITRAGALLVGTGDAATGTNPQNLSSLGGKVLRMNRFTATSRASLNGPTDHCGRSSTDPTVTTRSTGSSSAATTAGTRCRATTRACR